MEAKLAAQMRLRRTLDPKRLCSSSLIRERLLPLHEFHLQFSRDEKTPEERNA